MELNPDFIKENLDQIGKKEGLAFLREWIDNSSDIILRQKALKNYGLLEERKNFNSDVWIIYGICFYGFTN